VTDPERVGASETLLDSVRERFARDGVVVLAGLFDPRREIAPIQREIQRIISLVADRHGIDVGLGISDSPCGAPSFASGYRTLIACDRRLGGVVYDAVKQLPSFVRLVASSKLGDIVQHLRPGSMPAVAAGGYGIRIDNPGEDRFRAEWHQEYVSQLRSPAGIVFWTPLQDMTAALGPVEVCVGSHHLGVLPVERLDDSGRRGAYAIALADAESVTSRFEQIAPKIAVGDTIALDFRTIHRSGFNLTDQARWSMQSRWFDFTEPIGRQIDWVGSFATGTAFADVHPELLAGAAL
jgi:Phytanoyl-CoA dioxygenase (PhyH)